MGLAAGAAQAQALVASYSFDNILASSIAGAPSPRQEISSARFTCELLLRQASSLRIAMMS
jgi:hypothetical protein